MRSLSLCVSLSVAMVSTAFHITSTGPCHHHGDCLCTSNYAGVACSWTAKANGTYQVGEECTFTISPPGSLVAQIFDTSIEDEVIVGGTTGYSGSSGPHGVIADALTWRADPYSGSSPPYHGFVICVAALPPAPPPSPPPPFESHMDPTTLLLLLAVAGLVTAATAFLLLVRASLAACDWHVTLGSMHYAATLALTLAPWSWLVVKVDVFFVAIGAGVGLRLAMFSARVHGFRVGATEPREELRWSALALGFASCALFWALVASDKQGVLPTEIPPTVWECALLSELRVPPSTAAVLLVYTLLLSMHCLVWVQLTRQRISPLFEDALKSTVSEDFSPLSAAMFNSKQAYLWLLLIVGGGLDFPNGLVSICLFSESLHTFKSVILNRRLVEALVKRPRVRWVCVISAFSLPIVGMLTNIVGTEAQVAPLSDTIASVVGFGILYVSAGEAAIDFLIMVQAKRWWKAVGAIDDPLMQLEHASRRSEGQNASEVRLRRGTELLLRGAVFVSVCMVGLIAFSLLVHVSNLADGNPMQSEIMQKFFGFELALDPTLLFCITLLAFAIALGMLLRLAFCKIFCFTRNSKWSLFWAAFWIIWCLLPTTYFGAANVSRAVQGLDEQPLLLYAGTFTLFNLVANLLFILLVTRTFKDSCRLNSILLLATAGQMTLFFSRDGCLFWSVGSLPCTSRTFPALLVLVVQVSIPSVLAVVPVLTLCNRHGCKASAQRLSHEWRQLGQLQEGVGMGDQDREHPANSGEDSTRDSRCVCSPGAYGCVEPSATKAGSYAHELLYFWSILIPLGTMYLAFFFNADPSTFVVFCMIYLRLLTFSLKIGAFRVTRTHHLQRYLRTACLAWAGVFFASLFSSSSLIVAYGIEIAYLPCLTLTAFSFPSKRRPRLRRLVITFIILPAAVWPFSFMSKLRDGSLCYVPLSIASSVFALDSLAWLRIAPSLGSSNVVGLQQLQAWLQRDISPAMLSIFSAKSIYMWLLLLHASPTPSPFQLLAYGEILHCFKGFALFARVLHEFWWLRLGCAFVVVCSLVLFVAGSLLNHLEPDAASWSGSIEMPVVSQWSGGFSPKQRILFYLVPLLLVIPELLATAVLLHRTWHTTGAESCTAAQDMEQQEDAEQPLQTAGLEHPAETPSNPPNRPSGPPATLRARERYLLALTLILVLGSAGCGVAWCKAKEGGLAAAGNELLEPQRRLMTALSASLTTNVTVACDASGTLTAAGPQAVCSFAGATCNDAHELVNLSLRGQAFSGIIPAFNENVPNQLRELDLSENNITGTLPASIGQLSRLEVLSVRDNHISGTLPTTIGLLGNLKSLEIDTNHMRGPLPSEMGELWDLRTCQITAESPWLNYPENYFDCIVPDFFPSVCNVDECHPPLSPPSPPTPPPPPWY